MMVAEAGLLVRAPIEAVREAVLEPSAYTQGDTKVGAIEVLERTDSAMVARIHGRLGPFRSSIIARYRWVPGAEASAPGPVPAGTPEGAPGPPPEPGEDVHLEMLEGRLRGFRAVFRMRPRAEGTWLVHREEYDFGCGPLDPVLDRVLRPWARATVEAEVRALRRAAESGAGGPGPRIHPTGAGAAGAANIGPRVGKEA